MSHVPSENTYGNDEKGYSVPGAEKYPEQSGYTSPNPTSQNYIVPPANSAPDYTNHRAENFYSSNQGNNTWAWASYVALASSVVNFLLALIPVFNFFVVPFTFIASLVFVILAFVGVSERKNDKKGMAITSAVLLGGSIFAFIFSYVFLAVLSSV